MKLVLSHVNYTIVSRDIYTMVEREVKTFTNETLAKEYLRKLATENESTNLFGLKITEVFKRGE